MNRNQLIVTSAVSLIASASAGGAIGYVIAQKKLKAQYEDLANAEIAEAREFLAAQYKTDEKYESPSKLTKDLKREVKDADDELDEATENLMATYGGQKVNVVTPKTDITKPQKPEEEEEVVVEKTNNIFVNGEPFDPDENTFDLEAEVELRKSMVCYVVSEDEYTSNDEHYDQTTMTYFVYGDTLIDEDEKVIDDVEQTVGRENLSRFGHGSGDPDVVFVVNEARHMAYEILRSEGSYDEEVLGLTPDSLEHSFEDRRPRRRQRELFDG